MPNTATTAGPSRATGPAGPAGLTLLTMEDLLGLRADLRVREGQLSYWRRVVQGRLDVLTLLASGTPVSPADIAECLSGDARPARRSSSHLTVDHTESLPQLAGMDEAWEQACSVAGPGTSTVAVDTQRRLTLAEVWLTDQRMAVHAELDEATAELTRRTAQDPAGYLQAAEARWLASAG